jgi:D-alanyl-D-alanine carboxypeptidase (penicillin-binding protein 5/6)
LIAVLIALMVTAAPGAVLAQAPSSTAPPPPPPQAWIVVDADTGAIVDASNERTPLRPASVIKLLTALIALERLPANASVPVSPVAEGMPARKINMKAGQVWSLTDTLYSLLLVSANDAAVALAERVSGTRSGFSAAMTEAAQHLGLEDSPVLRDPAGLDAEPFAFEGGNFISARDLAIIARAAWAQPEIRLVVASDHYEFRGGDGIDHVVRSHNLLMKTYPGAVGMKTGYTRGAGNTLIGAATRNGRTMISVVLNAVDAPRFSAQLLDQGFFVPVDLQGGRGHLPRVANAAPPVSAPPQQRVQVVAAPTPVDASAAGGNTLGRDLVLITLGTLPALAIVARRRRREGKRRLISWG